MKEETFFKMLLAAMCITFISLMSYAAFIRAECVSDGLKIYQCEVLLKGKVYVNQK